MGAIFKLPTESVGAITPGLAIQQRERERALRRLARLREKASTEIDRLIAFLDASDQYVMTELEDDDDREDGADTEPSLGSLDRAADQSRWSQGSRWEIDAELDDCDREDDDPDEAKDQPLEMGGAA